MSTQLESENRFDNTLFQQNLPQYYRSILKAFRRITQNYVTFHVIYFCLFGAELFGFFFFLSFFAQSALLAAALGALFLTSFSYFVLLFYLQAKKPEQWKGLCQQFLMSCRQILSTPRGEAEHHLSLADALLKLTAYLQDFEGNFYRLPKIFAPLARLVSRLSTFCYREDVFKMKEILLQAAVQEHLKQIRLTPTDLEVHVSLATTYVVLSKIYPATQAEKRQAFAQLAMEEFSILNHFAPNDPWVHEQLAAGYRDLNKPQEEIQELERLIQLRPQDKEILYRLGSLYFKQGMSAKGLLVYEELKGGNLKKAEDLISCYGAI